MNKIEELIKKQQETLDNNEKASVRVGNAMHYPMVIMMNGENAKEAHQIVQHNFKRIWQSNYNKVVFVKDVINESVSFNNFENDEYFNFDLLLKNIENLKNINNADVFKELNRLCFYNIIDSSQVSSLDEFVKYYNLVDKIEEVTRTSLLSLAIILLDESVDGCNLSKEIKEYLFSNKKYNGRIVLASQTKTGFMLDIKDLFDTLASVMVLSNNDAHTSSDDESYNERIRCLYTNNNSVLTVAHSVQKRPTKEIIIQIVDNIIAEAENFIERSNSLNSNDLKKIFEIDESGMILPLENIFNTIDFSLDEENIKYMPFKNIPGKKIEIENTTYNEFNQYIFDGSFDEYIETKFYETFKNNEVLKTELSKYKNNIKNKITAWQCRDNMFAQEAEKAINSIKIDNIATTSSLSNYYKNSLKKHIRKRIFLPFLKELVNEMIINSKLTITAFRQFKEDIQNIIPENDTYNNLGNHYISLTNKYLNKTDGQRKINGLLASGNKENDFICCMDDIINRIVFDNESTFELAFIDEWVTRLGKEENYILTLVQETFSKELENKLYFHTNGGYPEAILTVYMFHLGDNNWKNETALYKAIKNDIDKFAIKNIHFVNASYDYKVEALKFFDITEGLQH